MKSLSLTQESLHSVQNISSKLTCPGHWSETETLPGHYAVVFREWSGARTLRESLNTSQGEESVWFVQPNSGMLWPSCSPFPTALGSKRKITWIPPIFIVYWQFILILHSKHFIEQQVFIVSLLSTNGTIMPFIFILHHEIVATWQHDDQFRTGSQLWSEESARFTLICSQRPCT